MAKKKEEVQEETKGNGQGRKVMVTHKDGGMPVARVELIQDLFWNLGKTRGEIRKILAEEYNHDVVYQIVYAATKPKKEDGETEVEAEAESEAA